MLQFYLYSIFVQLPFVIYLSFYLLCCVNFEIKFKITFYPLHYKLMLKQKRLRKIVLDKLYHRNQAHLKVSTRSNAPTQSTPNEPKTSLKIIQRFFQNFDSQCAIIYQPVKLTNKKPLKRSLEQQLTLLFREEIKQPKFKTQAYDFEQKIIKKQIKYPSYLNSKKRCQSMKRLTCQIKPSKPLQRQKSLITAKQKFISAILSTYKQKQQTKYLTRSRHASPQRNDLNMNKNDRNIKLPNKKFSFNGQQKIKRVESMKLLHSNVRNQKDHFKQHSKFL